MKIHVQRKARGRQRCRSRNQDARSRVVLRSAEILFCIALAVLSGPAGVVGDEPASFNRLSIQYERDVQPLLKHFCLECHSTKQKEGELDLEQFRKFDRVRLDPKAWQKVDEMLGSGEMPPEDSKQLTPEQRKKLRGWVTRYLHAEAFANAGDPGPVVLRRLNNAEYTYTIRDLTGVDLNPAHEFPTDSAAGEGFTNTGNALVMSPALLQKYLDVGKEIARHAVLLPDGFRFSPHATRRDRTDELLAQIREFYRGFVDSTNLGVGSEVGNLNVHSNTRIGLAGRLPLQKYLAATLAERESLTTGGKTIEAVAHERGLNAKYLGSLWSSLSGSDPSLLLDGLRSRWRSAKPQDAAALAADVASWQNGLWVFGPVGLIGRQGGPSRWMEPVSPLVTQQDLRFKFPALPDDKNKKSDGEKKKPAEGEKKKPNRPTSENKKEIIISLVATDAGNGNEHDFVVWQQPRLVVKGSPDILLRDVRKLARDSAAIQPANASTDAPKSTDAARWGLDPAMFGKHPNGKSIDAASLCVRAPSVISIRLPAHLAFGREFVTTAVLDKETAREGSVQVEVVAGKPTGKSGLLHSEVVVNFSRVTKLFSDRRDVSFARPILVSQGSQTQQRIESAMDAYRKLFPAALCFTQIVPVDEVLTLTLFYREDDHLSRLMLDDAQQARLDRLWEELHHISQSAFMRLTALELLLEVMIGNEKSDRSQYDALVPLRTPFNKRADAFKKELLAAEPKQIDVLVDFAARAYRRPLTDAEANGMRGLYRRLREQELSHDEAFRLTLARIFVSSPFLYRLENAPAGTAAAEVSDWELANRLSYFLWSSIPDEKLREAAKAGRLTHSPKQGSSKLDQGDRFASGHGSNEANAELRKQAGRMLADARVRRLATEFACQWLHIHDFDSLSEKSEKHFPEFADLRGDMYEESILFFTDLFQHDASLLSLLNADHTFVNERLARFYDIKEVTGTTWRRVEGMQQRGRGGILGLSTTLAKQSGASRTSPILRGNWVSEVLLGERLPRPPKNVPELPVDETATNGLTVRQLVAKHTSDPLCSSCHQRIDPFGFALESFDAIGRLRDNDLAGRPIDTKTKLPDGSEISGLAGLRDYLLKKHRDVFLRQFCRKLLGYAIARELQLSDEPLLTEMQQRLAKNNYRFSVAVETIVLSDQFRKIRGKSFNPYPQARNARWKPRLRIRVKQ